MTPTLKPRGPEVLAKRSGRCELCPQPISPGQVLLKVEPIGWVHVGCGDGYRAVIADHAEEEAHPVADQTGGVAASLLNAVREVDAAFAQLSPTAQESVEIRYAGLDREVDAAFGRSDRDRALAAVRAWKDQHLYEIRRAAR